MDKHPDALRWNARYQQADSAEAAPPAILVAHAALLPAAGRALDLACGLGGASLWLARRGWRVDALDISAEALAALDRQAQAEGLGASITTHLCDLAEAPLGEGCYHLIVVSRFLLRERSAALVAALAPGGLLYYQTWVGPPGRGGPSNPAYRLALGELPGLFPDLQPLHYTPCSNLGEAWLVARALGT